MKIFGVNFSISRASAPPRNSMMPLSPYAADTKTPADARTPAGAKIPRRLNPSLLEDNSKGDYHVDTWGGVMDQILAADLTKKDVRDLESEILARKLDFYGGIEQPWVNPDHLLRDKHRNLLIYDVMMSDDRIKSVVELNKRMILSVPYSITPASNSPQDVAMAKMISDQFKSMRLGNYPLSLKNVLDNFLDAKYFGHKVGEKVWEVTEQNKILLRAIKLRHSIFFDPWYDEFKNFRGMWIGRYYGGQQQVIDKAFEQKFMNLVYPYPKDGNMYGESDLKEIFPQYRAKHKLFNMRNERLEGWGRPIPVAIYDGKNMSPAEISALDEQLKRFAQHKYFRIPGIRQPDGTMKPKIELSFPEARVGTSSGDKDAFNVALEQIDTQIARKLLIPDKLGITSSDGGSYAMAGAQLDVFLANIEYHHDLLEGLMNPLVQQMVEFNFPGASAPTFEFEKITHRMSEQMLKVLIDNRIVDPREKWIRGHVGAPTIDQDEAADLAQSPAPIPYTASSQDAAAQDMGLQPPSATQNASQQSSGEQTTPGTPLKPPQNALESPKTHPASMTRRKAPFDAQTVLKGLDTLEAEFITHYRLAHQEQGDYLLRQIKNKKIIENRDVKALATLKIVKGDIKNLFAVHGAKAYIMGRVHALKHIRPRLKNLKIDIAKTAKMAASPNLDLDWLDSDFIEKQLKEYGALGKLSADEVKSLSRLRDDAYLRAGEIEDRLTKSASNAVTSGLNAGANEQAILDSIAESISEDFEKYATTAARTSETVAYAQGQQDLYSDPDVREQVEAFQYSAIVDDVTTDFCQEHDGQVILKTDPDLERIWPPNHYNCRSTMIPIFVGDNELADGPFKGWQDKSTQWGDGVSVDNRYPAKGFGKPAGL